jgi:hypothetical protein
MKYKITADFSHSESQPIPAKPVGFDEIETTPGIILRGLYQTRRKKMTKLNRRSLSYSVLMSKKGMPRANADLIRKAEEKTLEALTTPPGPLPRDMVMDGARAYHFLDKASMIEQLERTVDEMFGDLQLPVEELSKPFFPSTSANYMRSRSECGAVGELLEEVLRDCVREELLTFRYVTVDCYHEQSRVFGPLRATEQESLDALFEEGGEEVLTTLGVHMDGSRLERRWRKMYWKIFKLAINEDPLVEPVGLAEALKIRVISKGPVYLYTALKPIQRFMWTVLKRNPVFELIGTPVTEKIITKCLGDMNLYPKDVIISGDYKASTDNLHRWVSEAIARRIAFCLRKNGQFSDILEELLVRSLIDHIFVDRDGCRFAQKEGQLMGSVTSFPVLCIANAAMCRWAMEVASGRTYHLDSRIPLRVNGDDCVFRGPQDLLPLFWEEITKYGGLESSVGKTYYSRKFAVINSVLYDIVYDKRDPWTEGFVGYKPCRFVVR